MIGVRAESLLSPELLHAALLERHAGAKDFPDRENYVGASEVGACMRVVAHRKLHPEVHVFPAEAAGRMRAGQVLEGEIVALVRLAFKGFLRETGANQSELIVDGAPLRCHPDGRIMATALDPIRFSKVAVTLVTGSRVYLDEVPTGDGTLEIKTASSHQLRRFRKEGLPLTYQDQTQVEMGAQGVSWGLCLVVSRENLSEFETFYLQADADAMAACRARATAVISVVDKIRGGILSEDGLPGGEPDRGYCSKCALADTCPAMVTVRASAGPLAVIPPDDMPDIEAMVDEYLTLKPEAERYETVKDAIRDRFADLGVFDSLLPSGRHVKLPEYKGRETTDTKALKAKFPEVAAQVVKRGDPYFVLKVSEIR